MVPRSAHSVRLAVLAGLMVGSVCLASRTTMTQAPAQLDTSAVAEVDLTVADREGHVPAALEPSDLTILLDGAPRRVAWIRRVSRGPGAVAAATSRAGETGGVTSSAAEPFRTVAIVIDRTTLGHGDEGSVTSSVATFLDRLAITDRVAVITLPLRAGQHIAFSADRPAARAVLAHVRGLVVPAALRIETSAPVSELDRAAVGDPNRQRSEEQERPAYEERRPASTNTNAPENADEPDSLGSQSGMAAFLTIARALQQLPGRKIVAVYSAGVTRALEAQTDEVRDAAISARAVIHAFRFKAVAGPAEHPLDFGPFEHLSGATGGSAIFLDKKANTQIERLVSSMATCFTVGFDALPKDLDGRPHRLQIAASRAGLSIRAPLVWMPPTAVDDVVPEPNTSALMPFQPGTSAGGGRAFTRTETALEKPEPRDRDPQLEVALGRMFDYADEYVRQTSAVVMEESYRQESQGVVRKLRSDLLLIKPEAYRDWGMFRDVFEVDGRPVREREERLRRLFQSGDTGAKAQLEIIRKESARLNIGPIDRNINVPYYQLRFLLPNNRPRFRFKLNGAPTTRGVKTWRVEFSEIIHPTLISDRSGADVPVRGWFLVEQVTGAIVETGFRPDLRGVKSSIVVRYRRDAAAGVWVPEQMKESYETDRWGSNRNRSASSRWDEQDFEGTATYSKFRRFNVTTEAVVNEPRK
jgi:VWFA-related protein